MVRHSVARGRVAILVTHLAAGHAAASEDAITDVSGWSDERLEDFLATADVVGDEELGTGVTVPHRLTLEKDGNRVRAIRLTRTSSIMPMKDRSGWLT